MPHFHPRATEIAYVLEGRVYSGFVDTNNEVFAAVIEKGEVMVFPRGLVHFRQLFRAIIKTRQHSLRGTIQPYP